MGAGAGAVKVGLLGIADPALADQLGAPSEDVTRAARRDADRLRQQGAEVVVLLAQVDKALARRVARAAAVDLVILGRQVRQPGRAGRGARGDGEAGDAGRRRCPLRAGRRAAAGRTPSSTLFCAAAIRTRCVTAGTEATRLRRDEVERALKRLDEELARWSGDHAAAPQNDASFVAAKKREREALVAERASLGAPWVAPATSSSSSIA